MLKLTKIALFGLSADPFHLGHAASIEACKQALPQHFFVIMPCKENSLGKIDAQGVRVYPTDGEYRYEMLCDYFKNDSRVFVSRYEIDNSEPSYTINTVRYLQQLNIKSECIPIISAQAGMIGMHSDITLIIGTDNFLQIPLWHQWQQLLTITHLFIIQRPNIPTLCAQNILDAELRHAFLTKINDSMQIGTMTQFTGPQLNISSSYVKQLIRTGADDATLSAYLPKSVLHYIRDNIDKLSALYRPSM